MLGITTCSTVLETAVVIVMFVLKTPCKLHFVEATVYCKIMFKLMRLGSYLVMFYHILMVDFIKAYY